MLWFFENMTMGKKTELSQTTEQNTILINLAEEDPSTPVLDFTLRMCNFLGNTKELESAHVSHNTRQEGALFSSVPPLRSVAANLSDDASRFV